MAALKPQIDILKAKFKDDTQQVQVETMKMYKEFGVNPLGGCLPMIAQLPIWFALYRFFPASIEFRQAGFLWINDLTSYEVFAKLPFNIPFYGSHVALFAILWTISTLVYTYYTTKDMDMSANPGMKYMQYFMPVIFLSFFNTTAAGLTYYMFASNLLNIAQTIITRKWLISGDKIQKEFDDHKKKPKKKGGFTEKLEQAMKEQQRLQQEKAKKK
jgi:YidC/Oxa1 family membrane protein insertase